MTIDPEFEALCPNPSIEELSLLEDQLIREGCRDPLVAWFDKDRGTYVLVDGHNRRRICLELGIDAPCVEVSLADRAAAINWIVANQLGAAI